MNRPLSLHDGAKKIDIAPAILERAVENGLARPVEPGPPHFFSESELQDLANPAKFWPLLGERLKRNENGVFIGRFSEATEERRRNEYILPFSGCWLAIDGGNLRTAEGRVRNTHCYVEPCFRWACDFVVIAPEDYQRCAVGMKDAEIMRLRARRGQAEQTPDFERTECEVNPFQSSGQTRNPLGLDNRLSFQYELDVVAPADGVFLTRKGRREDPDFDTLIRTLASEGRDDELGFLIDHGNGELSQISHVLGRTVKVRPGQRVSQGEVLCKAGGKTQSMTHFHWALRDCWIDLLASGLLPIVKTCERYVDGRFVSSENVAIQKGMLVRNAE